MDCRDQVRAGQGKSGLARRPRPGEALLLAAVVAAALAQGTGQAAGDVIHLKGGGTVEGQQTKSENGQVRVRMRHGEVVLAESQIDRVEPGPLSWVLYESLKGQKEKYPDTADGHYRLGLWCRQHDLEDLARAEFARALELDPGYGPAHEGLGHVRIGAVWLEPKGGVGAAASAGGGNGQARSGGKPTSPGPTTAAAGPPRPAGESPDAPPVDEAARLALRNAEQEMIRKLRGEWLKRIRWIRTTHLESMSKKTLAQGAELLLAIRDPLAVEPMIAELINGNAEQRKLLAQALGQFHTSASTTALLEACLTDEEEEVRKTALVQLNGRADPRIAPYLTKALESDEPAVARGAAKALGYLGVREAIPALVKALTDKETRRVRTESVIGPQRRYFIDENGQVQTLLFRRRFVGADAYTTVTVTVFRTEVQEALIALTGQNYGFDADAWMEWYRRNVLKPQPPPVPVGERPPQDGLNAPGGGSGGK